MNSLKKSFISTLVILTGIVIVAAMLMKSVQRDSKTLAEYEAEYLAELEAGGDETEGRGDETTVHTEENEVLESSDIEPETETPETDNDEDMTPTLIGNILNGSDMEDERFTYTEGFFYEPLSANLRRYITGISYPQEYENIEISYEDLRYVHILHYDFTGTPTEGELICNSKIAQDLVEIFYVLYQNQYELDKVLLIDEYDGDDTASMEDNNSSCFNYRVVDGSSSLSQHAYGLAIDINPLYNPYVTYTSGGTIKVAPDSAEEYADRTILFPYKIDETDLCYKLFIEHGFTWGGNWNSSKDYQHFQKKPN